MKKCTCKRCGSVYEETWSHIDSYRDIKVCLDCWNDLISEYDYFIRGLMEGTKLTQEEVKDAIEREDC